MLSVPNPKPKTKNHVLSLESNSVKSTQLSLAVIQLKSDNQIRRNVANDSKNHGLVEFEKPSSCELRLKMFSMTYEFGQSSGLFRRFTELFLKFVQQIDESLRFLDCRIDRNDYSQKIVLKTQN